MQGSRRPWAGVLKVLTASLLATLFAGAFIAMGTAHAQVPPDLAPPDLTVPDLEPPDLTPPEDFPPDLAPPEGFPPAPPSAEELPVSPDALPISPDMLPAPPGDGLPVSADALPAPPGDGLPISPDALPAPPGGGLPVSPDALPVPPGDGLPVSPDALPIPSDDAMPDAGTDAEVAVDANDTADEPAPDAAAGTGPAGLPAAGGGLRGNLDNWSAAAAITLLAVAGSLLTVGARMRGMF